jgi:hypothetical protein
LPWAEVPQNSRPYFTVSSETTPTWRARSLYLYPPRTGWPSYIPGHWVPFCRLLRLAGLRWRYSNPPPQGCLGIPVNVQMHSRRPHSYYTPCSSHPPLLDHPNCILDGKYKLFNSSLYSPVTLSLFGPNILLSILFSDLSLCSSFTVRNQVSHSYRTTGKIVGFYILISSFLDSRREDRKFWSEWFKRYLNSVSS